MYNINEKKGKNEKNYWDNKNISQPQNVQRICEKKSPRDNLWHKTTKQAHFLYTIRRGKVP